MVSNAKISSADQNTVSNLYSGMKIIQAKFNFTNSQYNLIENPVYQKIERSIVNYKNQAGSGNYVSHNTAYQNQAYK